jgi:rod shape-determining protein MreC
MSARGPNSPLLTRGQIAVLVGLFIITALVLLLLDRGGRLGPLKGPLERPVAALSERFTSFGQGVRKIGDRFGNTSELSVENQRLQAENDRLRANEALVVELKRENDQLRAQANFAVQFPQFQSVPARVIGRDPTLNEKVLVIDRGSDDGIQKGMPVVSPDFLVGLVTEVTPKRSKVRLIIDQDMQIGVLLQDERGAGIMYGQWQQGGRLTVKHINRDVTVQQNAKIITSGLTSHVPKGLIVGFVTSWRKDEPSDTLQVDVVPYVNFDGLESVSVVLTGTP